jgi:hypothetical protein
MFSLPSLSAAAIAAVAVNKAKGARDARVQGSGFRRKNNIRESFFT